MVKKLFLYIPLLCLFACQQKQKEPVLSHVVSEHYLWTATTDDSLFKLHLRQDIPIPDDSLNKEYILSYLHQYFTENDQHPLEFQWVKQSGDTAFIYIPDATYLSERSGSSGSEMEMAAIVYNMTELPGINYVYVDFEEGSHASPGLFRRDSTEHSFLQVK